MRGKRRKLIGRALALTAASVLTVGASAYAQDGGQRGPRRGGRGGFGGLGRVARDLDLTDAQNAQIKQITDAFEASTKTLREQAFSADGGPFGGLTGTFDEAAVRAAAQARAAAQVEFEVARAKMFSQVYAVLTDAQKAKLAELRQKFEQRRESGARAEDVPTTGQ